jgi:hypothetical protein
VTLNLHFAIVSLMEELDGIGSAPTMPRTKR